MRARRRGDLAWLIAGLCGLVLVLWSALPMVGARAATSDELLLTTTWTDSLNPVQQPWFDGFYDAATPLAVDNVLANGDAFAKQSLIASATNDPTSKINVDFVVSGTRLSDAESAAAKAKGVEFLELPISATGLVFAVRDPASTVRAGWSTQLPCCKEVTEDGVEIPYDPEPYVGPIRLRDTVVSRLYYGRVELAADAEFREDNDANMVPENGANSATQLVNRIDHGAIPRHVRNFLQTTDPASWQAFFDQALEHSRFGDEEWPLLEKPTRSNQSSLANSLLSPSGPYGTPVLGGAVGPMTLANLEVLLPEPNTMDLVAAELKNARGDWVAPTAASILAGIEAGLSIGATPLETTFVEDAALTDASAEGAYPLSWLNWMIVPASGLTPEDANAIATIARFAVTDGQAEIVAAGEPALPAALVAQALALADVLVSQNCPANGYELGVSTNPGEYAPPGFELPAGITVATCNRLVGGSGATTTTAAPIGTSSTVAPTTTSAPGTTVAVSSTTATPLAPASRSGSANRQAPPTPPPMVTTPVDPIADPATADVDIHPAAATSAANLPYGAPEPNRRPFDRMTTMLLGGSAMFGFVRRFAGRAV